MTMLRRPGIGMPTSAGIGLRGPHADQLMAARPALGFLEILAENHMGAGTEPRRCGTADVGRSSLAGSANGRAWSESVELRRALLASRLLHQQPAAVALRCSKPARTRRQRFAGAGPAAAPRSDREPERLPALSRARHGRGRVLERARAP